MTLISPLSGDPFRRMAPFGPPFDPPMPGFPFSTTSSFDADTMEDFYSQRLRRLANTSSPTACPPAPSTACPSSTTQQTPPLLTSTAAPQEQPTHTSPRLSSSSDAEASTTTKTATTPTTESDASLTGKLKACEFCGKCFRFQSNLIVHRRSHTGEKPYKCPLCPHACTQASKLKRHMKTHNSAQLSSVCGGSALLSGLCGGDENQSDAGSSSGSKMSNEEDGNSDGEGEEEEEEEEDLEELDRDEEFRQMLMKHQKALAGKREDEQPTDLSRRTDSEPAAPTDLSVLSGLVPSCTTAQQRSSLLSEMMANSGLGNIQQYKEAFNQALAERDDEDDEDEDDDMEMNGTAEDIEGSDGGNADPEGVKSTVDNEVDLTSDTEPEGESSQAAKRIKLEQLVKSDLPPHSVPSSVPNHMFPPFVRDPRDLIFPNIWYPPAAINQHEVFGSAFMRAEPFMASAAIAARQLCENGVPSMRLKTGASPKTTLGLTSPIHPSLTSTSPTRVSSNSAVAAAAVALSYRARRRNDMCEFCGKIFKNCSNLTVHRRSHTGEKPYKCELCNYACAQSSKLTRHMKTHGRLGKDIYRCKFCCMPFSVPSTLEKHMRKCVENHNPSTSPPPQQQLPPLSLSNPGEGRSYSEGHSPLTPPQLPPLPAMTPIEVGDGTTRGYMENHSPLTPPHMPALPLTSPSERNCDDIAAQRKSTEGHSPMDAPKLLPPLPLSMQSDSRSSNNSLPNHSPPTPLELSLTTTAANSDESLQKFKENHSALSLSLSMPADSASKDACVRKFLANHQLRRSSLDSHHMAYMPSHQPASLLPTAMPAMTNSSAVSALLEVAPRAAAMTVVNTEASQ
ncbi:hypothetical protein NP493_368g01013 [Ridgeia piscesae]|uniref:C2H2-type domain-containing protein n=1 Tax=Ridgeia piscesae TaxID=27915 RepID=A0AAD9L415_RIDPI|nr:hypothetical protein NP493_368g01013 [Ridgeia piscesae]